MTLQEERRLEKQLGEAINLPNSDPTRGVVVYKDITVGNLLDEIKRVRIANSILRVPEVWGGKDPAW